MTQPPGDGDGPKPRRRPRYRGTHPRTFAEKYKERDPARFPEERAKVLASGKTPAGSHVPVLVDEVLAALRPSPGEIAVDATIGWGGHAEAILPRLLPGGRLIGLDVDPIELPKTERRLRTLGFGQDVLVIRRSNFAGLPKLLADLDLPGADCVLADLGASSMQLDDPGRGFSYKRDAPLDLRMNPERGQPAGALLGKLKKEAIEDYLRRWGDEPEAAGIASQIAEAARRAAAAHTLLSTSDVSAAVESAYKGSTSRDASEAKRSSLQRTFQALRILVNDEMTALETFLRNLRSVLNPGGRAAIISFHSGEDRRVKKALAAGLKAGLFSGISPEVVRPSAGERRANPRSAPAKLRWAVLAGMGLPR
ncbi:MAG: 16S rRNA (cytosine(1402)-N(4))-methyltransferase RsmH [Thermoanaerobaculia bacterium]